MRNVSHQMKRTPLSALRAEVSDYRKERGYSRETMCQIIVEKYEAMNGPEVLEMRFEPKTTDQIDRMKVNADRISRWLDDESKSNNLLPFSFHPAVLLALPMYRRVKAANEWLLLAGMSTRSICSDECNLNPVSLLQGMLKEGSEANQSVAALVDGATKDRLITAQREIDEAIAALKRSRQAVEAALVDLA